MSTSSEAGVQLSGCRSDLVEIAALRGRARELETNTAGRGLSLPPLGRVVSTADRLAMCVRPERWLVLQAPLAAGASAAQWQEVCESAGVAVDLSSATSVLQLAGPLARELLARSCRVDLHRDALPVGQVIATVMAQVSIIIAALPSGLLLLTPSTTARHFREWLAASAKPFGLLPQSNLNTVELFGGSGQ